MRSTIVLVAGLNAMALAQSSTDLLSLINSEITAVSPTIVSVPTPDLASSLASDITSLVGSASADVTSVLSVLSTADLNSVYSGALASLSGVAATATGSAKSPYESLYSEFATQQSSLVGAASSALHGSGSVSATTTSPGATAATHSSSSSSSGNVAPATAVPVALGALGGLGLAALGLL